MQIATIIVILVLLVIGLILFAVFARYFRLWIQSVTTGAPLKAGVRGSPGRLERCITCAAHTQ